MPCEDVLTPGRASASISNTSRRHCVRLRGRSIRTTHRRDGIARRAEHLLELVRGRNLELIVRAVCWTFVRTPSLKNSRMAKSIPLHVVVLHFAHALDA